MALRKVYANLLTSGLVLSTVLIVIGFIIVVKASHVPPPRSITPGEHAVCAVMPRGSQVLENNRLACFNELYGTGRFQSL